LKSRSFDKISLSLEHIFDSDNSLSNIYKAGQKHDNWLFGQLCMLKKIILKFTLKFKEGGKVNGHYTTKT